MLIVTVGVVAALMGFVAGVIAVRHVDHRKSIYGCPDCVWKDEGVYPCLKHDCHGEHHFLCDKCRQIP